MALARSFELGLEVLDDIGTERVVGNVSPEFFPYPLLGMPITFERATTVVELHLKPLVDLWGDELGIIPIKLFEYPNKSIHIAVV